MNTNKKTLKVIMDETNKDYNYLNNIIDNNKLIYDIMYNSVEVLEIEFKYSPDYTVFTHTYNVKLNDRIYQIQEVENTKEEYHEKLLILDITDAL